MLDLDLTGLMIVGVGAAALLALLLVAIARLRSRHQRPVSHPAPRPTGPTSWKPQDLNTPEMRNLLSAPQIYDVWGDAR